MGGIGKLVRFDRQPTALSIADCQLQEEYEMNSRLRLLLGMLVSTGLLGSVGYLSADDPKAPAPALPPAKAFKPVQDVERVMESQDAMVREVKDAIVDKEWESGETAAWILAELANVNHYHHNDPKYKELADKMSTQCVDLAKLLKKRKGDEAKAQMTALNQTCTACHDQFAKKW